MEKKIIQRSILKVNLFGQILIENSLINDKQLLEALGVQCSSGGFLGDILIKLGYINEEALAATFAVQFEACYLPLERYEVALDIFSLVSGDLARKFLFIPLERIEDLLVIAISSPLERQIINEIELSTGLKIVCLYAARNRIEKLISIYY